MVGEFGRATFSSKRHQIIRYATAGRLRPSEAFCFNTPIEKFCRKVQIELGTSKVIITVQHDPPEYHLVYATWRRYVLCAPIRLAHTVNDTHTQNVHGKNTPETGGLSSFILIIFPTPRRPCFVLFVGHPGKI